MQHRPTANIVIVDDTPDNLRLLFSVLSKQGYRVRPVPSGQSALTAVWKEPPDLILLDIMMPDMDGYTVCEALKADPRSRAIPVIFLSAVSEVFDKVRAFAAGGVDYIAKPFQVDEVLARVSTHLSLYMIQRQLQHQNKQLQHINAQLEASMNALEQRHYEMAMLNQLSTVLQQAASDTEALANSLPILRQLFAATPGAVYLRNSTEQALEPVAIWGQGMPASLPACPITATTWAQPAHGPLASEICDHCRATWTIPALCVPLIASNETLGLLLIDEGSSMDATSHDHHHRVALMVADHLALALSNLNLRMRLREQATRDPLTGLFNRYYQEETLEREIYRAERNESPIGFILLDIDHFKFYNDTYGHDGGDAVLRSIGSWLRQQIRRDDIACRIGGEEFLLILPGAALRETGQRAETLCHMVRHLRVVHQEQTLGAITISAGVASFPEHGTTAASVLAAADAALYQAKAAGRDCVIIADQPQPSGWTAPAPRVPCGNRNE